MGFEEIVTSYGLPVVVMAVISMCLVGFIKIFTKFIPAIKDTTASEKLSKVMSYLYIILALGFSFGVVCFYYGVIVKAFDWDTVLRMWGSVYASTQVLYPLYRDYGGRYLLLKVLNLFKNKNSNTDKVIEIIESVLTLTDSQKTQLEDKLNDK